MQQSDEPEREQQESSTDKPSMSAGHSKKARRNKRVAKHSTTINAGQFTGYLANLVREAGGGAGMTDKQIVQNASADHFRILKEASQPQKPSASDKGSSRGK